MSRDIKAIVEQERGEKKKVIQSILRNIHSIHTEIYDCEMSDERIKRDNTIDRGDFVSNEDKT